MGCGNSVLALTVGSENMKALSVFDKVGKKGRGYGCAISDDAPWIALVLRLSLSFFLGC
jgi:hypothetical protein